MSSFRDSANEKIVSCKNHSCYGMGLGIMILDDVYPGLPGDVRNASAWPYPIQYEILENIDIKALCYADNMELASYLDTIIKAAKVVISYLLRYSTPCIYFFPVAAFFMFFKI